MSTGSGSGYASPQWRKLPASPPNEAGEPRPEAVHQAQSAPAAAGHFLLIEVSDSSVDFDRSVKATLCAAAGVPELVDCRPDEGPARVLPLARTRWVPRCPARFGGWARGAAGLPRGGTCRRRHSDALSFAAAGGLKLQPPGAWRGRSMVGCLAR